MVYIFNDFNTSDRMLDNMIVDNLDLLDFPINNLGNADLSNETFLPHEIFPDEILQLNNNKQTKKNCDKTKNLGDSRNIIKYVGYRDFSQILDNQALLQASNTSTEKQTSASSSSSTIEKFPMKLHKIVERCEIDGYSSIISWMPHGRSFKIHNRNEFVTKVMPKYFYITRFTSFIRQLTLYGFYKCRKGADKGSFFHELFLRNRPGLCVGITRSSEKKRKLESEPNFYKMSYLPRIESSANYYNAGDVPDRPRAINYEKSNEENLSESPIETNVSLLEPSTSQDSSFEYFHKSQQIVARNLFAFYNDEIRSESSNLEQSPVRCSKYSRAA